MVRQNVLAEIFLEAIVILKFTVRIINPQHGSVLARLIYYLKEVGCYSFNNYIKV